MDPSPALCTVGSRHEKVVRVYPYDPVPHLLGAQESRNAKGVMTIRKSSSGFLDQGFTLK